MSTPGTVSSDAARAYELLDPLSTRGDQLAGQSLILALLDALTAAHRTIWQLAEQPGAAEHLHPTTVDARWLPWLARPIGARLRGWMTEQQRRDEIRDPSGYRRGGDDQLVAAARRYMRAPRRVKVLRRYNPADPEGDSPGHILVRVRLSDIDPAYLVEASPGVWDSPIVRNAVLREVRFGLIGHVQITNLATYAERRDQHDSYADMRDAYDSYADLRDADA